MRDFKRTNENYFFLGGFLDSDVDLVGDILNQNSNIHVSKTSPLVHLLYHLNIKLSEYSESYTFNYDKVSMRMNEFTIDNFYNHIEAKFVIDKNKAWVCNVVPLTHFVNTYAKIIVVYREIPEILYLMKEQSKKSVTECWKELEHSYLTFKNLYTHYPENFLIIDVRDLKNKANHVVDNLYQFLQTPPKIEHSLNLLNISDVDIDCLSDELQSYNSYNLFVEDKNA